MSLLLALHLRNTARGGAVVKGRASQHERRTLAATAQPALGAGTGRGLACKKGFAISSSPSVGQTSMMEVPRQTIRPIGRVSSSKR